MQRRCLRTHRLFPYKHLSTPLGFTPKPKTCRVPQQIVGHVASPLLDGAAHGPHIRLDVTRTSHWKAAVDLLNETFGGIDVLVNNAGIYYRHGLENVDEAEWDDVLAVNAKGLDRGLIEKKLEERDAVRREKDFVSSDRLRDELLAMGIEVRDTPRGAEWKVIR